MGRRAGGIEGGVSSLVRNILVVQWLRVGGGAESVMALGIDDGVGRPARNTLYI